MNRSPKKTTNTEAPISTHGVLIDIYGVGALVIGPSGVGKSECALDLVVRGHRLVADDLVLIRKDGAGHLEGWAPELSREYMEVRGLGLLNIRELYGAAAVRDRKTVDMVIEIVPLDEKDAIDRLGIEIIEKELAGVKVPMVRVPSWKGRNLTTIMEVAARNQILRWSGKDSAIEFERKHRERLCEP